jgi:serine phosphatase RsbU (regulator of sigma subunit)/anti-sigma regulatory factor (Ser/Thr protein kinase)
MTSGLPGSVPAVSPTSPTSIEVAVDHHVADSVRREVTRALQAGSVRDDVRADVELLVTELVSNVVRHEDARVINVEVTVDIGGAVTVTVTGGISEPSAALVHAAGRPALSSAGGRGLLILDSTASTWGTWRKNGKTTVWFTVDGDAGTRPGGTASVPGFARDVPATPAPSTVGAATAAQPIAALEGVATRAAVTAEQAAVDAAVKTADAARSAQAARARAATTAAASVAAAATRTVDVVQAQADELALTVARAAAEAADTVSKSIVPGGDAEAARAALQVAATVISTAAVTAEETARAAVRVARDVAATAAAVAETTAAEATAIEQEVRDAAAAVQAVANATARELAADTVERGVAVAFDTAEAAASAARLHEANRLLQRAGLRDRIVALALQEAMLPRLPESEDLRLAARYLTAAEKDQVGGDWYDALVLPTGTTSLVIGDVIGHNITAAAVMGQLRNILRALVWDRNEAPSRVVTRLDRAIRELHIDTIASLILVNVEPPAADQPTDAATLRWSNAGHPAPILIQADGTVVELDAPSDVLLGVRPGTVRRDHRHSVPPGATLLLYTDGLVETRTDCIDIGQRRLFDALRAYHHLEPGDLLDAVLNDMVGDRPRDDVAVLAVRFQTTLVSPGPASG